MVWSLGLSRSPVRSSNFIHLRRIMFRSACCNDPETPVEALRATTAMRVQPRDVIAARAAHGVLDEGSAAVIDN